MALRPLIRLLVVGPLQANCYIVGCERTRLAAVIDPGGDGPRIVAALEGEGLRAIYIINTHGHFDHTGANRYVKEATGAQLLIHSADAPMILQQSKSAAMWGLRVDDSPPPDRYLEEGDLVVFGDVSLEVLHTPGHTPGGISLFTDGVVFVGDTLFAGSIGRTDFPGGDYRTLLDSVRTKIFPLGDEVIVYPGHGPETTVGHERRYNPFFTGRGFDWL
ncbi:MAG: MBL fold metallo-hydrolase [Deltaproteobacteria bacterium]|nr:MAG: MBL fold metallo-hydrolase [Deltaproteobacteria bacterium]RLB01931.1 MAG: MBL fold metallo-hydrolase [Deltaproteobacteria bacterium]